MIKQPNFGSHLLQQLTTEKNNLKVELDILRKENEQLENDKKSLQMQLAQYRGEDIVSVIIWTHDDMISVLEKHSIPVTKENINVLSRRAAKALSDVSYDWDCLDGICYDLDTEDAFFIGLDREHVHATIDTVLSRLPYEHDFELVKLTEAHHPELCLSIDPIYDIERVADKVVEQLDAKTTMIGSRQLGVGLEKYDSKNKLLRFIFDEAEIGSAEWVTEMVEYIIAETKPYWKKD